MSSRELGQLERGLSDTSWPHTFTLTPITAGAPDANFNVADVPGTPQTGLACRYRANETIRNAEGERVAVFRPSFGCPPSIALKTGDLVSNIRDSSGAVLLAGPLTVEYVVPHVGFGPAVAQRVYLLQGETL